MPVTPAGGKDSMIRKLITAVAVALGMSAAGAALAGASPETLAWRTTADNGAIQIIRDGNHVYAEKFAAGSGTYVGTAWGVWLRRECDTVQLGSNGGGGVPNAVSFYNSHYSDSVGDGESGVRGCTWSVINGTVRASTMKVTAQFCRTFDCVSTTQVNTDTDGVYSQGSYSGINITRATDCDWLDDCLFPDTRIYGYDWRARVVTYA